MSESLKTVTPTNDSQVAYAIQVSDSTAAVVPQSVALVTPRTPDGTLETCVDYTQIYEEFGIPTGHWGAGFFSCFQHCVPNALMATLCPCVSLAQISSRLGLATYSSALFFFAALATIEVVVVGFAVQEYIQVQLLGHTESIYYFHAHRIVEARTENPMFWVLAALVQIVFVLCIWHLRRRVRAQFLIPGASATDCLAAFLCPCCTTAQIASHIKSYTPRSCDFTPVDTLPSYK